MPKKVKDPEEETEVTTKKVKKVKKTKAKADADAAATPEKKKKRKSTDNGESEKKSSKKAKKVKKAAADSEEDEPPKKKTKKTKKKAKKAAEESEDSEAEEVAMEEDSESEEEAAAAPAAAEESEEEEAAAEEEEEDEEEGGFKVHKAAQPGDAAANPTGTTEVFMGNLSFSIDEDSLKDAFKDCGGVTNIKWLEDRDTGKFKGCGFISFESPEAAAKAVGMNGADILGRPVKCDFAKGKAGGASGGGGGGGAREVRPMQAKPDGCTTLFAGNLNFNIDDDAMRDFFKDCGEVGQIRWLTDRDSGEFRGCGFIEFADPDSALEKAAKLNGSMLMGRQIRLDYAAPRERR